MLYEFVDFKNHIEKKKKITLCLFFFDNIKL